jgi:predicted DNA-binding transcriptional regulator AlpA
MPDSNITASLAEDFRLITAKELAAMLDISIRTIWRRRSDGSMPSPVKVGRSIRWRLLDIRNWIAKGCTLRNDS